jgi:hypothetical protein
MSFEGINRKREREKGKISQKGEVERGKQKVRKD